MRLNGWLQRWRGVKSPAQTPPEGPVAADVDAGHVLGGDQADQQAWIGVGLDGTLARGRRKQPDDPIGEPVPLMVARVKHWVESGYRVKILTARAACAGNIPAIASWLHRHGLPALEITHYKDLHMVEFWDDRAVQVIGNTGRPVGQSRIPPPAPPAEDADPAAPAADAEYNHGPGSPSDSGK